MLEDLRGGDKSERVLQRPRSFYDLVRPIWLQGGTGEGKGPTGETNPRVSLGRLGKASRPVLGHLCSIFQGDRDNSNNNHNNNNINNSNNNNNKKKLLF